MNDAEQIKLALIDAHRNKDWEKAKELSQLKQQAKKVHRCIDCGIPLAKKAIRCKLHWVFHRFYGRTLKSGA